MIFAVCELRANEKVIVHINQSGNVNGELPEFLPDPNSLKLEISKGGTDENYPLIYDFDNNYYIIDPSKFQMVPEQGVRYILRGLANTKGGETDVELSMPYSPKIDSIRARRIFDPIDGNTKKIEVTVRLNLLLKEDFFCFDPKLPVGVKYSFPNEVQAYKPLKHKNGFLVDVTRIKKNTITFLIDDIADMKTLSLDIANLTAPAYYYNKYVSENVIDVESSYARPTIGGDAFNISNSKAIGSFGGSASTTRVIEIK